VSAPALAVPVDAAGRRWSLLALVLCLAAVAGSLALIVASGQDPSRVRWGLLAVPPVVSLGSALATRRRARIAAAVVLGCWCVLAAASVGALFVPAFAALLCAASRSPGGRP